MLHSSALRKRKWSIIDNCRAMLCISAAYGVVRCLSVSVRLSVTFVYSVEKNKYIFKIFSLSARRVATEFLFFHTERHGSIPTGTTNVGVECRWGMKKSLFLTSILLHRLSSTLRPSRYYQHGVGDTHRCGGDCWWRETTTKCLWQEASTLYVRYPKSLILLF